MDFEQQRWIVQQQRAGFAALRRLEIEKLRNATFADRLDSFKAIMQFADHMNWSDDRKDDEMVRERWRKVRTRYDDTHQ